MQDDVRTHIAKNVLKKFEEREIRLIKLPSYSSNLNSIEILWDDMKNWIQEMHEERRLSYDKLRETIKNAWNAISQIRLDNLMNSMNVRCQVIIDANEQQTSYWRALLLVQYYVDG